MTEKTPPLPGIELCAWCQEPPERDRKYYWCSNPGCELGRTQDASLVLEDWNEENRRITAELRKAFEAGVLNSTVFKLGDGELLPSELLTRLFDDYLAERKA